MVIVIPICISLVSLIVSIYVAYRSSLFNEMTTRRLARECHSQFCIELDKALMDNPCLWAIYDTHALARNKDTSPEATAQREAFLYLHFNMFEVIRDFYTNIIRCHREDEEYWHSWEVYIRQLFRESSEARDLFLEPRTQEIYSEAFIAYIDQLISECETREPNKGIKPDGEPRDTAIRECT